MHRAHTVDIRPTTIFMHNGAPQALDGCYENRMAGRGIMHRAHTVDIRPTTIFMHNGAPQALDGCYENRMAGRGIMHRAHTVDIRPTTIFMHNGAPQALDGCQGGPDCATPSCLKERCEASRLEGSTAQPLILRSDAKQRVSKDDPVSAAVRRPAGASFETRRLRRRSSRREVGGRQLPAISIGVPLNEYTIHELGASPSGRYFSSLRPYGRS